MRAIRLVLLCTALLALSSAPSNASQGWATQGRVPISVTFHGATFEAEATGYIEKAANSCDTVIERSWVSGPFDVGHAILYEVDRGACKVQLAVYQRPASTPGLCESCRSLGTPTDDEIRTTWTVVAGPVTIG